MAVREGLRRRPFLVLAAPFAAGIALPGVGFVIPGVLAAVALVGLRRPSLGIACWALIGLAAGWERAEWNRVRPETDVRHLAHEVRVRVEGRVLEPPRIFSEGSGSFPLEIGSVRGGDRPLPWTGRLQVRFYRSVPPLTGGETIWFEGRLKPLQAPTNPGERDRREILGRAGIGAVVSISGPVTIVSPASPFRVSTRIENARSFLRERLARHAPPEVAALQAALLLGCREELPADFTTALQRTGTAHFLAVSGFNLVLVLVVFWFLLLACGVRGPAVPAILLVLLLGYTALTGWQVSVVRAFLMSAAILGARLVGRRSDVINSLCLAALAILIWDPGQLFDTGFQLSFVAVMGIVGIGPVFHEFLAPPPGPLQSPVAAWVGRQARGALSVTLGAWLATAPIVLATFNLATPVILAANLALCPLVTIQSYIAIAALPLALVCPPAATAAGFLATGVYEATAWSAESLTGLPAAYLFLPALPAWGVAGYYVALALWIWRCRVKADRLKPWICGAFAISLAVPPLCARSVEHPYFGIADVGRGSFAYARMADGGAIVFDCGSLTYRDPGALPAAPVLWSQGITRVHTIVLSHEDADHVNGARSLIERMRVKRLVVPTGFDHPILDFARERGLEVVHASRGWIGPGMEILGPSEAPEGPANERSLVVRLVTPHGRILIPGDIEERGTRSLLESGTDPGAEILVLPHHGKMQALHRELLAAVRPRIVLVSAPEGYASREVLDHARSVAVVYQTGHGGWIEVGLAPQGLEVRRGSDGRARAALAADLPQ